jgi:hypothetical protein
VQASSSAAARFGASNRRDRAFISSVPFLFAVLTFILLARRDFEISQSNPVLGAVMVFVTEAFCVAGTDRVRR